VVEARWAGTRGETSPLLSTPHILFADCLLVVLCIYYDLLRRIAAALWLSIAIIPKKGQTGNMGWWDSIRQKAGQSLSVVERLIGKSRDFLQTRRKSVLICLTACAALLVLCVIAIVVNVRGNNSGTKSEMGLVEAFSPRPIPPEEFFLPAEPDFLPETIPERERRESWTTEDALPFWTNPLDAGALDYTELMSKGVDDLMERVP
jgi:hypothetical protein